jgi:dethiobiotin synthetase
VARNYLGSINHTLLSAELLRTRDIEVAGIIFNDVPNEESESIIESYSGLHIIGRIGQEESWTPEVISRYSTEFKSAL